MGEEKPKEMPPKEEMLKKEEAPKEGPKKEEPKKEANVVFIGKKPVMNYVIACLTFFNSGGNEMCIKARGRAISRAVDTVEVLRRSFVKNVEIKGITLGTEEVSREQGRRSNVSIMEITLVKQESK